MNIEELLDLANLDTRIKLGHISERKRNGMTLYNYTARAQYEKAWDNETRKCRGLVVDSKGNIVARPFEKFFNASEHESLPVEPFDVYEKVDGSLIIAATSPDGRLSLTSRGSFDSEQANAAIELWQRLYGLVEIPPGQTWCFEFVAPWNRIVVNYGDAERLVLLAALDNETGQDLPAPAAWVEAGGQTAKTFNFTDLDAVLSRLSDLGPDEEGYVIRFRSSGLRVKAKGDEYLRLHRLVTGCTSRMIWESLAAGQSIEALLERVPDEFAGWVRSTEFSLRADYTAVEAAAQEVYAQVRSLPTRKEQAIAIAAFEHRAVVFRMLDGRPYADVIWKAVCPPAGKPFYSIVESGDTE